MKWRSRVRLVDEVAEELRERIYAGEYPLGTKLRQEQLADDLQISRTPLREALRVLESEGLLHSEPGRGVRVVPADINKVLAAYQLREMVDGLAARLAAQSPDAAARAGLADRLVAQRAALEPWVPGEYTRENVAFHLALIELSGNEYLAAEAPIVRMTSQVFTPVALVEPPHAKIAVAQHGEIVKAVVAGDGAAAEQLARAHIRSTMERIATRSPTTTGRPTPDARR
ncbi:MAG: GntR family transcriptional regulator [Acidobacteriota bacterium]|nr:GntR family transcriptional regulator [Acidobacteriota bacterium]